MFLMVLISGKAAFKGRSIIRPYIAEDGMTEQGIRYHIKKESFRADTDIEYFTTTKKALLGMQDGQSKIWTSIGEEGQLASLGDL